MMTSGPSDPKPSGDGWCPYLWPTPVANDDNKTLEAHQAMKRRMPGGSRQTVTSLNVMVRSGMEPLIYSPGDTPVSRSVSPGSAEARTITVTSGRRLLGLLPTSGPVASCLKTCMGMSRWDSTLCLLTWKPSTTKQGYLFFRLLVSVPPTDAIASGSSGQMPLFPTVTAQDAKNNAGPSQFRRNTPPLNTAVHLWPTPRATESETRTHKPTPSSLNGTHGFHLGGAVADSLEEEPHRMWPTPRAAEAEEHGIRKTVGGKLSAAWVTRLMGYPDGWMEDLPEDPMLETATMTADQRARQRIYDPLTTPDETFARMAAGMVMQMLEDGELDPES